MKKTKRQKIQEKAKKMLKDFDDSVNTAKSKTEVYRTLAKKYKYKDHTVVYQLIRRMKQNENN